MELRIDKVRKEAEIFLTDGSHMVGNFFLSPRSPHRPGEELMAELLSGETAFFPFHLKEDHVLFVQKEAIAMVVLGERELNEELPYLKKAGVVVSLLSGETLEGNVYLDLPQHRSRLSDFLNQCRGFFYLEVGGTEYLINPRCVKLVRPVTGG